MIGELYLVIFLSLPWWAILEVLFVRLSTGQLEEAILEHPDVAEAAVVGLPDKVKGHIPLGFCVLAAGNKDVISGVSGDYGDDAEIENIKQSMGMKWWQAW